MRVSVLPTLQRLLARHDLALTLLTPEMGEPTETTSSVGIDMLGIDAVEIDAVGVDPVGVDASVVWVHSSDLLDPTPFLAAGHVLLTTGTQFGTGQRNETDDESTRTEAHARYVAYVERLRRCGVVALGFGTEVVRDGTPEPLRDACRRQGLPLFEVPFRTPFIAVERAAGDLIAEDHYARTTWALSAQHAIAVAALRPDGLSATLAELSRQLDHWVALFDTSGALDRVFPAMAFARSDVAPSSAASGVARAVTCAEASASGGALATVRREAGRLLQAGQRASSSVLAGGETLTLQTLGRPGELRGVLALGGTTALDRASQSVVTSVIALAGLALEQNSALGLAVGHLRSGLLRTLLGGDLALVQGVAEQMWGPLPAAPVRIARVQVPPKRRDAFIEWLELRVEARPGTLFFARLDDTQPAAPASHTPPPGAPADGTVVLCLRADDTGLAAEACSLFEAWGGLSDLSGYDTLPAALAQSAQALERAREAPPGVVEFAAISRQGVLAFLARADVRDIGLAALGPLLSHDAQHGSQLVPTLRVWLEHNGQFGTVAEQLGVHRHTVRARIGEIETLLGRDLSGFPARAELWAALLAVDPAGAAQLGQAGN